MNETLLEHPVGDAQVVVTLESAKALGARHEVFGHPGFDVEIRVSVEDNDGEVLFTMNRTTWVAAHGRSASPSRPRLKAAAESLAAVTAALWAAGEGKRYNLRNGAFLSTVIDATPLL